LFSEDLAACSKTLQLFGDSWINRKTSNNPQFDAVGDFTMVNVQGIKMVNGDILIKAEKIVVNPQFDSAAGFKDGKAVVSLDEKRE
jgi:hypothetical protein